MKQMLFLIAYSLSARESVRLVSVRVDEVSCDRLAAEVEHDEAVMVAEVRYVIAHLGQGSVMRRVERVEATPTASSDDVVDVVSHSLRDVLCIPKASEGNLANDFTEYMSSKRKKCMEYEFYLNMFNER